MIVVLIYIGVCTKVKSNKESERIDARVISCFFAFGMSGGRSIRLGAGAHVHNTTPHFSTSASFLPSRHTHILLYGSGAGSDDDEEGRRTEAESTSKWPSNSRSTSACVVC